MITIIVSLVILAGLVGLFFIIWKKGESLALAICTLIFGVMILGCSHCAIFMDNVWYWAFVIPAIFGSIVVFSGLYDELDSLTFLLPVMVSIFVTCVSIFPAMIIDCCNNYSHVIIYDYTISIEDDIVNTEFDVENIPSDVVKAIQEKIEQMKECGSTYYEGKLVVKYICDFPLYKNHEENCKCTDSALCDFCEEYTEDYKIIN